MNERTISKDRYEQVFNTDMSTSDDMVQFLLDVYSQDVRDVDNLKPIIKQKLDKFNTFLNEDNIIKKLHVYKMLENENGKNYLTEVVTLKNDVTKEQYITEDIYKCVRDRIIIQRFYPDLYEAIGGNDVFRTTDLISFVNKIIFNFEYTKNSCYFGDDLINYPKEITRLVERKILETTDELPIVSFCRCNTCDRVCDGKILFDKNDTVIYQNEDDATKHAHIDDYANIIKLDDYALQNLHNDKFDLSKTKIKYIGKYAFRNNVSNTGTIQIILPEDVTYIDRKAFEGINGKIEIDIRNTIYDHYSRDKFIKKFHLPNSTIIKTNKCELPYYKLVKCATYYYVLFKKEKHPLCYSYESEKNKIGMDIPAIASTVRGYYEKFYGIETGDLYNNLSKYVGTEYSEYLTKIINEIMNTRKIEQIDYKQMSINELVETIEDICFKHAREITKAEQDHNDNINNTALCFYNMFKLFRSYDIVNKDEFTNEPCFTIVFSLPIDTNVTEQDINCFKHVILIGYYLPELYKKIIYNKLYGINDETKNDLIGFIEKIRNANRIKFDFDLTNFDQKSKPSIKYIDEILCDKLYSSFKKILFIGPYKWCKTEKFIHDSIFDLQDNEYIKIESKENDDIKINAIKNYNELASLGNYALMNSHIDKFDFSKTKIRYIGHKAFYNSDIRLIILPQHVIYIQSDAFAGANIKQIDVRSTILDYLFDVQEFKKYFGIEDTTNVIMNEYEKEESEINIYKRYLEYYMNLGYKEYYNNIQLYVRPSSCNVADCLRACNFDKFLEDYGLDKKYSLDDIEKVVKAHNDSIMNESMDIVRPFKEFIKDPDTRSIIDKYEKKSINNLKEMEGISISEPEKVEKHDEFKQPNNSILKPKTLQFKSYAKPKIITQTTVNRDDNIIKNVETYIHVVDTDTLLILNLILNYDDYIRLTNIYEKNGKFIEIRPLQTLIIDASLCNDTVINTKGYASVFFTNTMAKNKSIQEITIAKNTFLFEISKTMIPTNSSFQQLANELLTLNFDLGKFTSLKKIDMSKSSIKHIRLSMFNNTHDLRVILSDDFESIDVTNPISKNSSMYCNCTNLKLDFRYTKYKNNNVEHIANLFKLTQYVIKGNVKIIVNNKINIGLYVSL